MATRALRVGAPGALVGDLRLAVAFLTRLPVGAGGDLSAGRLSRAALWFPAVGVLVGTVLGGVRWLAESAGIPVTAATVLAVAAAVLLTGGLHEDGLADVADGAGAHVSAERRLEILRDSRVGTYGALALVLAVLLAVVLLAALEPEDVLRAAIAAHVLARWSALPHSAWWPPARADGAGALVRVGAGRTAVATLYTGALVVLVAGVAAGLAALAAAALATVVASSGLVRSLGGTTGDTYGAVNKAVELTAYVVLAAWWAG